MTKPIYVELTSDGHPCWHLVAVKPTKLPLLQRLKAGEAIEVSELGDILKSGWGTPPKDEIDYQKIDA